MFVLVFNLSSMKILVLFRIDGILKIERSEFVNVWGLNLICEYLKGSFKMIFYGMLFDFVKFEFYKFKFK